MPSVKDALCLLKSSVTSWNIDTAKIKNKVAEGKLKIWDNVFTLLTTIFDAR